MLYLLIFLSCFTLVLFATPYAIDILVKLKIVDQPGGRKLHSHPIPRMGGILIYLVSIIAFFSYSTAVSSVKIIILCSSLLVLSGIFDDIIGLTWRLKFVIQTLSVAGMVIFLMRNVTSVVLFGNTFPGISGYILLLIFIVGTINSVNLMDGMDGIVSGFSLLMLFFIMVLAYLYNDSLVLVLAAAVAGSTLGFFKYNFHPARIFLGDTGSLALGFFLVISSIFLSLRSGSGNLDLTFPVIFLGVPIVDTFKVMIIRVLNKKSPFLPDRNHLHHIIFGSKVRYRTTVFIIYVFTFVFVLISVYYMETSRSLAVLAFAVVSLLLLSIKRLIRILRDSAVHRFYAYFRDNSPRLVAEFYKRIFVPLAVILLSVLFFFLIPGKTQIAHKAVLFLMFGGVVLFIFFVYQNIRSKVFNDIYIFLNVVMFFVITNLSYPLAESLKLNPKEIDSIVTIILGILLFLILLFILLREKIFKMNTPLLGKIDVSLLLAISAFVVFQNLVKYPAFYSISGKLIIGFVAYLSYKIITHFNKNLSRIFLYLSFVLILFTFAFIYFY